MNNNHTPRKIIFLIIILLIGMCFLPISIPKNVDYNIVNSHGYDEGQILFAPMYGTNTYLIYRDGEVIDHYLAPACGLVLLVFFPQLPSQARIDSQKCCPL